MPRRGRPPISRTKEETLTARRKQVRKNVQAYRQRKQTTGLQQGREVKARDVAFVLEHPVQSSAQYTASNVVSTATSQNSGSIGCDTDGKPLHPTLSKSSTRKPNAITSTCHFSSRDHSLRFLLPQEICATQVSRQQFAANAASAFALTLRGHTTGPHWSQMIPEFVNRDVTLDLSIQALCFLQFCRINNEQWMLQQSLQSYDKALIALQKALAHARDGFRSEIFAASMGLSAYELLQETSTQGKGWLYHIEGAVSYLNMFPSLNICALNHQLSFHFLETVCIFDALGCRRPSLFSTSQWWRDGVDRFGGSAYGTLLRMLTSLPAVLEQCDAAALLSPGPKAVEKWTRLLGLCKQLEEAFQGWFQRVLSDQSSESSVSTTAMTPEGAYYGPLHITDVKAPFRDLYTARLYLLYWSAMILLYESIATLSSNLHPDSTSQCISMHWASAASFHFAQGATASSYALASSILDSAPFCLSPSFGIVGKSLVVLPLSVAGGCFRRVGDMESTTRCGDMLERLGQGTMKFGLKVKRGP